MEDNQRRRVATWEDPAVSAEAVRQMSGLAFLRAIAAGELPPPPISRLMAFKLTEVDEGRVVFTAEPAEFHYNPIGTVHGGLAATLLDSAMACAIQSLLPAGVGYTTAELHVNYTRAIRAETGLLRCVGEIIHSGRRVATASGTLTDAAGTLYAHGTTTCVIFR